MSTVALVGHERAVIDLASDDFTAISGRLPRTQ